MTPRSPGAAAIRVATPREPPCQRPRDRSGPGASQSHLLRQRAPACATRPDPDPAPRPPPTGAGPASSSSRPWSLSSRPACPTTRCTCSRLSGRPDEVTQGIGLPPCPCASHARPSPRAGVGVLRYRGLVRAGGRRRVRHFRIHSSIESAPLDPIAGRAIAEKTGRFSVIHFPPEETLLFWIISSYSPSHNIGDGGGLRSRQARRGTSAGWRWPPSPSPPWWPVATRWRPR